MRQRYRRYLRPLTRSPRGPIIHLSPPEILLSGFLGLGMLGACLLKLPGMHQQLTFPCITLITSHLLLNNRMLMIGDIFRVSLPKLSMLIHTLASVCLDPGFIERRKNDAGQHADHHNDH